MPVFRLVKKPLFPPVAWSETNGLLAVGGDLSPERLLAAYAQGIFPWVGETDPILWWSPDPRLVLFPNRLHISRSMRHVLKQGNFQVTYDRCFREVITSCRKLRQEAGETWITEAMLEAYCRLHERGFAHSVETWQQGRLAGGLYGISLGACFFGESMFTRVSNASKVALITLTRTLQTRGFLLIDCQSDSQHLRSLGAELMPRQTFIKTIAAALEQTTQQGDWGNWLGGNDRHVDRDDQQSD